jgi:CRISPR-associated protein Csc2
MTTIQASWQDSLIKQVLDRHLLPEIPIAPKRNMVNIIVLREFSSTAVLTTDGQLLDVELVRSGCKEGGLLSRVVLQKRKQVAPERRTGRAMNRQRSVGTSCGYLNDMCGKCPDCLIYGFAAVSGEGSQRSRVLTDSGFAIRSYESMQRSITLNAIDDTTKGGVAGSAFAEREHIRPQVFFPTIETVVDVTPSELVYILRNILATSRYGAESNRQGYVDNHIVGLVFGQAELTSNLKLTQKIYDLLYQAKGEQVNEMPLDQGEIRTALEQVVAEEVEQTFLPAHYYQGEHLGEVLASLRKVWKEEEATNEWLQQLENDHREYQSKIEKAKKKSK